MHSLMLLHGMKRMFMNQMEMNKRMMIFDSYNPTCFTSSHKLFLASIIGWLYGCHLQYRKKAWVYALSWLKFIATFTLGLRPRQGFAKVGQDWTWESHFMLLGMQKSEGMNPHTPKWTPILGVRVLKDSWIFRGRLQGPKLIGLKSSWYHWKSLGI
jgi:hypothetical protein